jgi:membrane protease YdiL (CAAX protease family)
VIDLAPAGAGVSAGRRGFGFASPVRSLWPGRNGALWSVWAVLGAISLAESIFVYGSLAFSDLLSLGLAVGLLMTAALAPIRPELARTFESLALVPLYILFSASMPWFFLDQQFLLPAVYSLVIAISLWHLHARGESIRELLGLRAPWRRLARPIALAMAVGIPTGVTEYLVLMVPPPAPTFQAAYLVRDSLYMLAFVALAEELLFRGIVQRDMERLLGRGPGLFLGSLLFAIMHLTWRSVPELGFVFVAGALMGYFYQRTGNLAASIGLHAVNNVLLVSIAPYLLPYLRGLSVAFPLLSYLGG